MLLGRAGTGTCQVHSSPRLTCLCKLPVAPALKAVIYPFFAGNADIHAIRALKDVRSKALDSFSWNWTRSPLLWTKNANSIKPRTKLLLLVCYTHREKYSCKHTSLSMLMQNFHLNKINPSICTYLRHLMLSCPSVLCCQRSKYFCQTHINRSCRTMSFSHYFCE